MVAVAAGWRSVLVRGSLSVPLIEQTFTVLGHDWYMDSHLDTLIIDWYITNLS